MSNRCSTCPYKPMTTSDKVREVNNYIYQRIEEQFGYDKQMTPKKYELYLSIRRLLGVSLRYDMRVTKSDIVRQAINDRVSAFELKMAINTIIMCVNNIRNQDLAGFKSGVNSVE